MPTLEQEVLSLCQAHSLVIAGDRLILGVSGGPDSMAMLHILAHLAPQLGTSLIVAHVDHGLRPAEAPGEEALVRDQARVLGLDCEVTHLEVRAYAKAQGVSLEEAARDLRYAFFETLAKAHVANKIAVAHTADDQAEEILIRLIRGSGRNGLSGMSLLRDGRLVRPLLTTSKATLLDYLGDKAIPFANDSSNTDRRYLRNQIRLDLLPALAHFNPNIKQTLRQTATILRDEDTLLARLVDEEYPLCVQEASGPNGPRATLACALFNRRPIALRRRIIERLLHALGAKGSYGQIEHLTAVATKAGGQWHLANGLLVMVDGGELSFSYPQGRRAGRPSPTNGPPPFHHLLPRPGRYQLPERNQEILVERLPSPPSQEIMRQDTATYLDAGTVSLPLVARNHLPGDRFVPMNSGGHKKVSRFLIDQKVPRGRREQLAILLSADQVVAILGLGRGIDQEAQVTEQTTEVLKISLLAPYAHF